MPRIIEKVRSLKELWKSLGRLPADRKYIAGGTDLAVAFNLGLLDNECWIDISDTAELGKIRENEKEIFVGAGVRISDLEKNSLVKKWFPALIESAPHYASPSLRNMATLGGNLANASPSADGICALAASEASVLLNLKGKRRRARVLSLVKGPKKTALRRDEIIEGFFIPKRRHRAVFLKLIPREMFGIGKAGVCVCAAAAGGVIREIGIAFTSVAPKVMRAAGAERFLRGKRLDAAIAEKAASLAASEVSPIDDMRSRGEYRREMCAVLLERALSKLIERK